MGNPKHTKIRGVRVPDEEFDPAAARAAAEGITVSDVVRAALRTYGSGAACRWVKTPKKKG